MEQQQASDTANCATGQEATAKSETAADSAPKANSAAPSAQPRLTLKSIAALLNRLDEQRALYVLKKLPPQTLARALDQILSDGSPAAAQPAAAADDGAQAEVDRRGAERTDTDQIGKIIYNNLMSVTDCKIADLSPEGCRVTIGSTLGVPECFTLQIGNGGTKRECKVIWRKHYEMGVKFIA